MRCPCCKEHNWKPCDRFAWEPAGRDMCRKISVVLTDNLRPTLHVSHFDCRQPKEQNPAFSSNCCVLEQYTCKLGDDGVMCHNAANLHKLDKTFFFFVFQVCCGLVRFHTGLDTLHDGRWIQRPGLTVNWSTFSSICVSTSHPVYWLLCRWTGNFRHIWNSSLGAKLSLALRCRAFTNNPEQLWEQSN